MDSSEQPREPEGRQFPFPPGAITDRELIARYLLDHKDRIRAIARRKLTQPTRAVFDSEDVLSSVLRRLDALASRGWLRPRSEDELWALIATIARNSAINRTRLIERARSRLTEDGPYAYELMKRLQSYETDDEATLLVYRMMMCVKGDIDRQLLNLILRGSGHKAAGDMLGISEEASRQRWMRIRQDLASRFTEGKLDG